MTKFTKLEADVLKWIASHVGAESLQRLLSAVSVEKREYTVCGFHIDLSLPESTSPLRPEELPEGWLKGGRVLTGPGIESPGLDYGGGALLFFEKGLPSLLELYAYGDVFPERLEAYTLVAPPKNSAPL